MRFIFQILSNILSYLSVEDLKELRFVSQLWNEESVKHLRKRHNNGTLSLDLINNDYKDSHQSMKLFRCFVDMWNISLSTWRIEIPELGTQEFSNINISPGHPGAKLLEDLNHFLSLENAPFFPNTLEFHGNKNSRLDYDVGIKILQTLGGTLMIQPELGKRASCSSISSLRVNWNELEADFSSDSVMSTKYDEESIFSKVKVGRFSSEMLELLQEEVINGGIIDPNLDAIVEDTLGTGAGNEFNPASSTLMEFVNCIKLERYAWSEIIRNFYILKL